MIEPLLMQKEAETPLYQTPLMLGSGMVRGWAVSRESESQAINALRELAQPSNFHRKYQTQADKGVLLFAIGDGNHSLAAAKTMWEHNKSRLGMNHPSRFALVEIENVRQEGLVFEPIHRVLFEPGASLLEALDRFGIPCQISSAPPSDVLAEVDQPGKEQKVGVISAEGTAVLTFTRPTSHLALGTLQRFLDDWLKQDPSLRIDYIHGTQTVMELGAQPGNIGFYVSTMPKDELFPTVIHDGVLPRKAFSMGEAVEKRFYLEGRRIR